MPIPVCKTEVLKNENRPTWKPVFLNIQQVGSKVRASLPAWDQNLQISRILASAVSFYFFFYF